MKYKIFSKQNFSLQCPGTTTCVVAKPLVFITPMRYIPYTFFCLINLILARPSLLSSILLDASNPITKFSPEISSKYLLWWLMPSVAIIKTLGGWIMARIYLDTLDTSICLNSCRYIELWGWQFMWGFQSSLGGWTSTYWGYEFGDVSDYWRKGSYFPLSLPLSG